MLCVPFVPVAGRELLALLSLVGPRALVATPRQLVPALFCLSPVLRVVPRAGSC